jgi:hypothetical protein
VSVEASRTQAVETDSVSTEIEVDVTGRWAAIDLLERLVPFRSFLVQETTDRWVVNARTPGCRGEQLADAVRAIEEWSAERRLAATMRVQAAAPGRSR